jgi:copper chaperone CopZ
MERKEEKMIRTGILFGAALTVAAAMPAFAAPTLKATVSHMCCGQCASAVQGDAEKVAWVTGAQTDRPSKSISVAAKPGMDVDAMALFTSLDKGGFPPTSLELSGAKAIKIDVGHLCCGGCSGPLETALKKVAWIKSADVKPNAPVMLTIDPSKTVDLRELLTVMSTAGYSPTSMVVSG